MMLLNLPLVLVALSHELGLVSCNSAPSISWDSNASQHAWPGNATSDGKVWNKSRFGCLGMNEDACMRTQGKCLWSVTAKVCYMMRQGPGNATHGGQQMWNSTYRSNNATQNAPLSNWTRYVERWNKRQFGCLGMDEDACLRTQGKCLWSVTEKVCYMMRQGPSNSSRGGQQRWAANYRDNNATQHGWPSNDSRDVERWNRSQYGCLGMDEGACIRTQGKCLWSATAKVCHMMRQGPGNATDGGHQRWSGTHWSERSRNRTGDSRRVTFTLRLVNLGIVSLGAEQNSTVLANILRVLEQEIASQAGHEIMPEHIAFEGMSLSSGSLIARLAIVPPVGVPVASVQSRLAENHTLLNRLAQGLEQVSGTSTARQGGIEVTYISAPTVTPHEIDAAPSSTSKGSDNETSIAIALVVGVGGCLGGVLFAGLGCVLCATRLQRKGQEKGSWGVMQHNGQPSVVDAIQAKVSWPEGPATVDGAVVVSCKIAEQV